MDLTSDLSDPAERERLRRALNVYPMSANELERYASVSLVTVALSALDLLDQREGELERLRELLAAVYPTATVGDVQARVLSTPDFKEGTEIALGEWATIEGDGSGTALPPIDDPPRMRTFPPDFKEGNDE